MENRPLVKFIRNYIRDSSGVFSISSLVRISMTSFPAFTLLFVQKYSCLYNKKKITQRLEDMNFIFSWQKTMFYSLAALLCKILFLPLENKIHILAPPCNILSITRDKSGSNSPPFQGNVQISPFPGTMHSQKPGTCPGECC